VDDFEERIDSLHDEAGAAGFVGVCRVAHAGELLIRLICGDDEAAGAAVVLPLVSSPRNSLVCAICDTCGRADDASLIAGVSSYLKTSVWPELQILSPEQSLPEGSPA